MDAYRRVDAVLIACLVLGTGFATWALKLYIEASDNIRSAMRMGAVGAVGAVIALVIALLIWIKCRPIHERADRKK